MTKSRKGEKSSESEEARKEHNPYTIPSDAQILAYWHYRNNAHHPADTWRISHTLKKDEKQERPSHFDLMEELRGRSTKQYFSKMRYIRDIRLLSKMRLLIGQKKDACIQFDQLLDIENRKFLQFKREYKECLYNLERFLALDHEESMRLLSQASAETESTNELGKRRNELSRQYGQVRLLVYRWEEEWRTVKACHRFLHRVSPVVDFAEDAEMPKPSEGLDASKMSTADGYDRADSLEYLIECFHREASELAKLPAKTPSELGFVEPDDLLQLFHVMEVQNLSALIHLESLGGPMADMISRINDAQVRVKGEIEDIFQDIKELERAIEREEQRAYRLERLSQRLVQRNFRALVCSEETLHARILVEDAYESCIAKNEASLDVLTLARALESHYEQLSAQLDGLPRHLVIACETEGFQQEMRQNREAEEAAEKFELMHRLLASLKRLLEPSQPRRRVPVFRSTFKKKPKKETSAEVAATSALELLHDDLFGDFCKTRNLDGSGDEDSDEKEL